MAWFERWSALRELRSSVRREGEGFGKFVDDQLRFAQEAFDSGNREQAAVMLSAVGAQYPEMVKKSRRALHLLLELGLFDEADVMIQEGRRRYPHYDLFARGYPQVAHRRGNLEEALRRCEIIRKQFPRIGEGYSIAADCLARLGRPQEAETMVECATRMIPDEVELQVQHARNATQRREWPEALRRWEIVRSRFQQQFRGPLGVAQSLKEMGRYDEAEKVLSEARERFPKIDWLCAEWAEIATARGDFEEAAERWKTLLKRSPTFTLACLKGSDSLRKIGLDAEADRILEQVVARVPTELSVHLEYARVAHRREDWPEAAKRWALVTERFPDCGEAGERAGEALAAAARQDLRQGQEIR